MQKPHLTLLLASTGATLALGLYLYKKYRSVKLPTKWKPVGKVTKLCIFPMKSGRRIEVETFDCQQRGPREVTKPNNDDILKLVDRSFVVYHDESSEHRTARHYPKLVLIEIRATGKNSVSFNAPGMETLHLVLPDRKTGKIIEVKHHKGEGIKSIDCGNAASKWISRYIYEKDSGLGLVYHDGTFARENGEIITKTEKIPYYQNGLKNEYTGLNSDIAAVLMVNQVSVDKTAEQMEGEKVDVNNFRPNIVINGPELKPFEEFQWDWIKIGDVAMKNVGECVRCIMTLVNMETGERRTDREPLKTLERISEHPNKYPLMGINTTVLRTGLISVGDTVYINEK